MAAGSLLTPTILKVAARRGSKSSITRGENPTVCFSRSTCVPSGSRTNQSCPLNTQTSTPWAPMSSTARRATSGRSGCWASTLRSGVVSMPPLKPAIGAVIPRPLTTMARPRGGRLLMIENAMPRVRSAATAAMVSGVSVLSRVTKVPSTSEMTAETVVVGTRDAATITIFRSFVRDRANADHPAPSARRLPSVRCFLLDRTVLPLHDPPRPRRQSVARSASRLRPHQLA